MRALCRNDNGGTIFRIDKQLMINGKIGSSHVNYPRALLIVTTRAGQAKHRDAQECNADAAR